MLTPILVLFVFALYVAKYFYDNRRFYQLAAKLPDVTWDRWLDSSLPLLGYAHRFLGTTGDAYDSTKCFAKKAVENGGIMRLWMGPNLYTIITDASAADIALTTCLQKDKSYRLGKTWAGIGLVTADYDLWKRNRKLFNPAFSARVADGYLGIMNEHIRILTKRLELVTGKGIVDVEDYLNKASLSVLLKTALNVVGFNMQIDEDIPFLKALQDYTNVLFSRGFRVWLHSDIIFHMTSWGARERRDLKIMHEFSYKIIRTKREEIKNRRKVIKSNVDKDRSNNQIPYLDLLMKLCDEDKLISETQVRAEIDTSLEAGYASSAISVGVLLSLLGAHPRVQEKLYTELNEYFGDSMRDVEKLDLTHLPYLDCVSKEVFRMHPLTPFILRSTEQDLKISDKYTLPAGSGIMILPWGLHHDPKVWGEDHETFRPERWEDKEAAAKRHVASYIPFSHGSRNCIGKYHGFMQFKIFAIHLVRQFKIYADPEVPLTFKHELFMKQRHGVFVALEKR